MKRVSLECFTWVRGVADAGAKERSLCAEFSWCERQSSPVPPSLCLTSSFGVLVLFPGMCPIFFGCFFYFKFGFFLFAVAWMLIAVGMPHRSLYLVTWKLSSMCSALLFCSRKCPTRGCCTALKSLKFYQELVYKVTIPLPYESTSKLSSACKEGLQSCRAATWVSNHTLASDALWETALSLLLAGQLSIHCCFKTILRLCTVWG